jgi:hypothetical protein
LGKNTWIFQDPFRRDPKGSAGMFWALHRDSLRVAAKFFKVHPAQA